MLNLFLTASLGWFLLITFGLLTLVVFIGGWSAVGSDGGALVVVFLFSLTITILGIGILFGGNFDTPQPYAFHPGAIALGVSPLLVAFGILIAVIWRVEKDAKNRESQ